MKGEAYAFEVGRQATVRAGNYAAVAAGTVTLLQALKAGADRRAARGRLGEASLPCVMVRDKPKSPYRGLMVDLARQWHSIGNVKDMVVLCRWYKINTLHLHLTDGESFTFPSAAYPQLCTPDQCYTVEQLRDLEAFARDRGVTILPELEMPGHASALVLGMPEVFANKPNTWEQGEKIEMRTLRTRVPALGERVWNPDAGRSYADFNRRHLVCDPLLDKLIRGSR